MTKRDYIAIAKVINLELMVANAAYAEVYRTTAIETLQDVTGNLADVFASDNPKFNRKTFATACGFDIDTPKEQN